MFEGWLTAALALAGLYVLGILVGALGRNMGVSAASGINESPFPDNGWWSLVANLATYLLALALTTVAVAARLRDGFATVSEERLGVVLLLTGGIPLLVPRHGGWLVAGFLIAVWAVRAWVVRDEFRFPRPTLAVIAGILLLTIASYGVLHPVWVQSSDVVENADVAATLPSSRTILFFLNNTSRVGVEVDSVSGAPLAKVRAGFPWTGDRGSTTRNPPSSPRAYNLTTSTGAGAPVDVRVRYRVLGLRLSERLRVAPVGLARC